MVKLRQDQIAGIKADYDLTDEQIVKGWRLIQDNRKGVNEFTRGIGLSGRARGEIRDRFLALLRENSKAKKSESEEPSPTMKPKFPSRY